MGSDTGNDLKRAPRRGAVLNLHRYKCVTSYVTNSSQFDIYKMHIQDIESQIAPSTSSNKASTGGCHIFTESCCAKMCLALTTTILLSPFAICDLYYATSDDACVNQNNHGLTITMHSYLMASGTIMFIFIGGINASIFLVDLYR